MDDEYKALYYYEINKKSYLTSYFLWLFLGLVGFHRIYNKYILSAAIQMGLAFASFLLLLVNIENNQQSIIKIFFSFITSFVYNTNAYTYTPVNIIPNDLLLLGASVIIWGATLTWWLLDLLITPKLVSNHNRDLAFNLGLIDDY